MNYPSTKTVEIKSPVRSKINWTAGLAVVGTLLTMFGFELSADDQAVIVSAIGIASGVLTWIWRTWFNKTVTK